MVADTPAAASFRLQGPNGKGLEHGEPNLQTEIDAKLLPIEDDMLLRRVLYGWTQGTAELMALPAETLSIRLNEMLEGAPELVAASA